MTPEPTDFKPIELATKLMREMRVASLATLEINGEPLATLTVFALDSDGVPLILISSLSAHTQNLIRDPRFSLLIAEYGKGDALAHPRISLIGVAILTESAEAKAQYIRQNPKSKLYAYFTDFSLWRLIPHKLHVNGGFARAFTGKADELLKKLNYAS